MKFLYLIFSLVLSQGFYSQQVIEPCDYRVNTYSTSTNMSGNYYWIIDNMIQDNNSSIIIIDWQEFEFGIHNIKVVFESNSGCESDTISYTVTTTNCESDIYAPNTFTPNSDDINSVWQPIAYNYTEMHYTIYNRWGEIIFESFDGSVGWNGTYGGRICQDGVYVYSITWKDKTDKNKPTIYGHVTLIR